MQLSLPPACSLKSAKMQAQLLLPSCSSSCSSPAAIGQYDFAKWKFSSVLLTKNRFFVEKARKRFGVVYDGNCRTALRAVRAVSEAATDRSQRSRAAESVASELNARDLEARDESSQQEHFASTGAAPFPLGSSFRELNFTEHHLLLLGFVACVMTGALSCVLLAAIPTLLAMKRAAESLGKLADTAREELPGTMAAVRLSGMEISDLTMELSDLGQEISAGVRNSSRAVRAAEDGLRRIGTFTSVGEGERAGGGGEASGGSRSKKYPRGTDASSQSGPQLDNPGSPL